MNTTVVRPLINGAQTEASPAFVYNRDASAETPAFVYNRPQR